MRDLIRNLDTIVRQIDQMAHTVADGIGSGAEKAGEELTATLSSARDRLEDVERDLQRALKRTASSTSRYVQDHPWPAIAIAAAAAFAIGALVVSGRRSSPETLRDA